MVVPERLDGGVDVRAHGDAPLREGQLGRLARPQIAMVAADGVERARSALRDLHVERLSRPVEVTVACTTTRDGAGSATASPGTAGGAAGRVPGCRRRNRRRWPPATMTAHKSDVRMMANGSTRIGRRCCSSRRWRGGGCWNAVDSHCPRCAVVSERAPRAARGRAGHARRRHPGARRVRLRRRVARGGRRRARAAADGAGRVLVGRAVDAQAFARRRGAAAHRAARRRRRAAAAPRSW